MFKGALFDEGKPYVNNGALIRLASIDSALIVLRFWHAEKGQSEPIARAASRGR